MWVPKVLNPILSHRDEINLNKPSVWIAGKLHTDEIILLVSYQSDPDVYLYLLRVQIYFI